MPIKVGFLVGKDTDVVEDPKYDKVGDASFLKDLPDKYRVDPDSKEYLKNCEVGTKGLAHADIAIPWYIHKHYDDIEVDIIFPEDISLKRLKGNLVNYIVGYDVINGVFESPERLAELTAIFKASENIMPGRNVQEFIYYKSMYLKKLEEIGVPIAPTIYCPKEGRSVEGLLKQVKERGWKTLVMKQSFNAFCLGFMKVTVEECEKNPKVLQEYFEEFADCPEYIVQEAIEGFTRNWETRCFWWNGEFLYAIANKAAVSTADGQEVIVTGDDIPEEFLENAKRVGKEALKALPQLTTPDGQPIGMTLMRTDIGCSDSQVHDKNTNWDPNAKTFFLNELEQGGTTYFIRHLKFDAVPMWAKLYVEKTREIHGLMHAKEPEAKKARKAPDAAGAATMKKPAAAGAPLLKKPAAKGRA